MARSDDIAFAFCTFCLEHSFLLWLLMTVYRERVFLGSLGKLCTQAGSNESAKVQIHNTQAIAVRDPQKWHRSVPSSARYGTQHWLGLNAGRSWGPWMLLLYHYPGVKHELNRDELSFKRMNRNPAIQNMKLASCTSWTHIHSCTWTIPNWLISVPGLLVDRYGQDTRHVHTRLQKLRVCPKYIGTVHSRASINVCRIWMRSQAAHAASNENRTFREQSNAQM